MFPGHRLSPGPLSKIQGDPESFRHILIPFPGFAYMRLSYPLLGRVIFYIAESPDDVADPDGDVFMATSDSEEIGA
jgi:hypothetical protein